MSNVLEQLRSYEIDLVRPWMKPSLRVLELGGGNGYQAGRMAGWGCTVESIDVTVPSTGLHHKVTLYDGRHIPFEDGAFDLIFSSNVLEHIVALPEILGEMHRVLKPQGLAIHILPSTAWRFWTILTHYPNLLMARLRKRDPASFRPDAVQKTIQPLNLWHRLKNTIVAPAHGEYHNALQELYTYSAHRWTRLFQANDFQVVSQFTTRLFYTGHLLFPALSLHARKNLSVLGSAAKVYVLTPKGR